MKAKAEEKDVKTPLDYLQNRKPRAISGVANCREAREAA